MRWSPIPLAVWLFLIGMAVVILSMLGAHSLFQLGFWIASAGCTLGIGTILWSACMDLKDYLWLLLHR